MIIENETNRVFIDRLGAIFRSIPIKANFLKDLGFNISYSGFRYFIQRRRNYPSEKLLKILSEKMGYDLALIPVKKNDSESAELSGKLYQKYFNDLDEYLEKYADDEGNHYVMDYGEESTVAKAAKEFKDIAPDEQIPMDDLF